MYTGYMDGDMDGCTLYNVNIMDEWMAGWYLPSFSQV